MLETLYMSRIMTILLNFMFQTSEMSHMHVIFKLSSLLLNLVHATWFGLFLIDIAFDEI